MSILLDKSNLGFIKFLKVKELVYFKKFNKYSTFKIFLK